MILLLKTRKGTLLFSISNTQGPSYVKLETPGGKLQICEGGGFYGDTLEATPSTLESVVRRWHRQRLARLREARGHGAFTYYSKNV